MDTSVTKRRKLSKATICCVDSRMPSSIPKALFHPGSETSVPRLQAQLTAAGTRCRTGKVHHLESEESLQEADWARLGTAFLAQREVRGSLYYFQNGTAEKCHSKGMTV